MVLIGCSSVHLCVCGDEFLSQNLAQTNTLMSCILNEFEQLSLKKQAKIEPGFAGKSGVFLKR